VKIWALEAFKGTVVFSGGLWGLSEILGVVGGSWRKRSGSCEVREFFRDFWVKFWGIWSG
jgi:hypothetical protein